MSTKRATLRMGSSAIGITTAKSSNTRAKRKAATAKRIAFAAASATAVKKAAAAARPAGKAASAKAGKTAKK